MTENFIFLRSKIFLSGSKTILGIDQKQIYLDKDHAQLQATIDRSLLEKIDYLKALISHENLDPSYNELLRLSFDAAIEKIEKKKGIKRSTKGASTEFNENTVEKTLALRQSVETDQFVSKSSGIFFDESPETIMKEVSTQSFSIKSSRYISRDVKRIVLNRSKNQCEHIHSNGQRCTSNFQLQFDHIIAFSKGGRSELENIQTLCRVHNAYKGSQ